MSPRKRIRARIVEVLRKSIVERDVLVTGRNLRAFPTPSIQVTTPAEAVSGHLSGQNQFRTTTCLIVLRDLGDDVLDNLDDLAELVERALGEELSIDGHQVRVTYATMSTVLDSQQEDRIGTMELAFDLGYATKGGQRP